jgi:hypothetical protein
VQNTAVALIQETLAQVNTRMTLSVQYGANSAGIQRVDNVMVDASKAVAESLKTLDATLAAMPISRILRKRCLILRRPLQRKSTH